jgi:tetratricopeptide (TPR) repeat protein
VAEDSILEIIMNALNTPGVGSTFVILILLITQASGQRPTPKDFNNGLQLINKGLELKNLREKFEQAFKYERDVEKAAKLEEKAADALKNSRAAFLQAVSEFKAAINAEPNYSSAYYHLGWAFNELEQYSEAIAPLEKARQLDPKDSSTIFELGWAYDRMEQFEKAVELFKIAVKLRPDYSEAWFELGWINEKMKQYPAAAESYKHVIKLKPDNVLAHYNLALVHLKLGNKSAARERYIILKTLDPYLANSLYEAIKYEMALGKIAG